MAKIQLLLAVILVSSAGFAQGDTLNQIVNGKKHGKWIKRDQHNRVIYKGQFDQGKPVGTFTYLYDTKEIKTISVYSDNGKVCRTKHFFPGDILMAEGKYVNKKRDSIWKFYNAPGALVSEEGFKLGMKHGDEKNFNGKGALLELRTWKDSVLHGPWKKFYENGDVQQSGEYVNGKLEGKMEYFYPGGVKAATGNYKGSLKHGKWVYYDRRGKIEIQTENYFEGKQHGYFTMYSEKDGAPQMKGGYQMGHKDGTWKFYNKEGKLEADTTYKVGSLHGPCIEYYENGKVKTEALYHYSQPAGVWKTFDEEGVETGREEHESIEAIDKKRRQRLREESKKKKK